MKDWKTYNKNLWGSLSIIAGAFLLVEHIMFWEEVAFFDFIGHEWLGIVLVFFGIGLNINFSKDRLSEELIAIKEAWKK